MALFKRKKQSERPGSGMPPIQAPQQQSSGSGPVLPGIAGYHGLEPLSRTSMPQSRFDYRRPDGKDQ